MKPRIACPTARADAAESAPSRPLHSAACMRVRSRVGVDTLMPALSSSPP
jgi:hypothetical protein